MFLHSDLFKNVLNTYSKRRYHISSGIRTVRFSRITAVADISLCMKNLGTKDLSETKRTKLGVGHFTSISGHFFANFINSFHKIEVRWAQHVKILFGSKYGFVLFISKKSLQVFNRSNVFTFLL